MKCMKLNKMNLSSKSTAAKGLGMFLDISRFAYSVVFFLIETPRIPGVFNVGDK